MATSRMTTSFDFDDLVSSLQIFMRNSDQFRDVNWDGSAAKALIRVLAYNTQLQQTSNGFLFNELSLDSASIRRNVASLASSTLGYTPKGKRAASYNADILVTPNTTDISQMPAKIVLDRKAKFFAAKDSVALNFSVDTEYEAELDVDLKKYIFKNVKLVQGEWVQNSFVVQTDNGVESYVLPNDNIDTNFMRVGVLNSDKSTDIVNYSKFNTVFDLSPTANIYFLTLDRFERPKLEFGDDRLAKRLKYGNIILIDSLITDGDLGNNVKDVQAIGSIGGYFNIEINPYQVYSQGGSDEEDIETIRKIAPMSFAAQGNAVSASDYVAITKELYADAGSVVAWGGEDNIPPKFGYEMVAVKPKSGDTLNDVQKLFLKNLLMERCVGSISPIIVDPDYTYLNISTNVLYSSGNTVLSEQSIKVKINQAIRVYSQDQLEFFGSDFIYSKLIKFIDSVDSSILGNVTEVNYSKKFTPVLNVTNNYTFNFHSKLKPGSITFKNFKVLDSSIGWNYTLFDLDGLIYLQKVNPDNPLDVFVFPTAIGTVAYTTGIITLTKFKPIAVIGTEGVVIQVTPDSNDPSLFSSRNQLLKVDTITVVAETRESIKVI